jgi:hypothetical protein
MTVNPSHNFDSAEAPKPEQRDDATERPGPRETPKPADPLQEALRLLREHMRPRLDRCEADTKRHAGDVARCAKLRDLDRHLQAWEEPAVSVTTPEQDSLPPEPASTSDQAASATAPCGCPDARDEEADAERM